MTQEELIETLIFIELIKQLNDKQKQKIFYMLQGLLLF